MKTHPSTQRYNRRLLRGSYVIILASLLLATLFIGLTLPANAQQPVNGITEPKPDEPVGGVVLINGTATHPDFLRFEIAFFQEANPVGWISFAEGDQPVVDGTLAVWDTTVGRNVDAPVFPDGVYQLRLRVVRNDYNYDEFISSQVIISNDEPTPTPTITATVALPTPVQQSTPSAIESSILPTLTPFPTPSPQATPADQPIALVIGDNGEEEPQGVFAQLGAIDTGRFSSAFWLGVRLVAILFGIFGLYLLFRGALRRLWRIVAARFMQ